MVLWDTAETLWVSGNNTLTLKQSLPEEGYISRLAAVFVGEYLLN